MKWGGTLDRHKVNQINFRNSHDQCVLCAPDLTWSTVVTDIEGEENYNKRQKWSEVCNYASIRIAGSGFFFWYFFWMKRTKFTCSNQHLGQKIPEWSGSNIPGKFHGSNRLLFSIDWSNLFDVKERFSLSLRLTPFCWKIKWTVQLLKWLKLAQNIDVIPFPRKQRNSNLIGAVHYYNELNIDEGSITLYSDRFDSLLVPYQ